MVYYWYLKIPYHIIIDEEMKISNKKNFFIKISKRY